MRNYYYGLVSMKADMNKVDYICDDERSFEIPKVYFNGTGEENDETVFSWGDESVLVVKDKQVIKYTESVFSKILLKDEDGKTDWLDGRIADILGVDIDDAEDVCISKEYQIEEYDFEKSIKRRYKVVLDETLDIDGDDIREIKNFIGTENKNGYSRL